LRHIGGHHSKLSSTRRGIIGMESKILLRVILVSVLALVLVTGIGINRWIIANGPPTTGSFDKFKPASKPAPVPAVEFTDANGNKINLRSLAGKFTVLNIWATWCAPCVAEMPSLEKLKETRENDHFTVITVSEDRGGKIAVDKFFKDHQLELLPRDIDPEDKLSAALALAGLPTTLLIDPQGNEIGRLEGDADWIGPDAQKLINYYIDKESAAK